MSGNSRILYRHIKDRNQFMYKVSFTEFVRPNARQIVHTYSVTEDIHKKFLEIEQSGGRLTVEDLNTGLYNVCLEIPGLADFISDLCTSNKIESLLNQIILNFDKKEFLEFKKSMEREEDIPDEFDLQGN